MRVLLRLRFLLFDQGVNFWLVEELFVFVNVLVFLQEGLQIRIVFGAMDFVSVSYLLFNQFIDRNDLDDLLLFFVFDLRVSLLLAVFASD